MSCFAVLAVGGLISLALVSGSGVYSGYCEYDGIFYHSSTSFVQCSHGIAYIQPCAPGTRNSDPSRYDGGYSAFCDVNLVDYGYAAAHSAQEGYGEPHGYGDSYSHKPHDTGYGTLDSYGYDTHDSYVPHDGYGTPDGYGTDDGYGTYGYSTHSHSHKGYGYQKSYQDKRETSYKPKKTSHKPVHKPTSYKPVHKPTSYKPVHKPTSYKPSKPHAYKPSYQVSYKPTYRISYKPIHKPSYGGAHKGVYIPLHRFTGYSSGYGKPTVYPRVYYKPRKH